MKKSKEKNGITLIALIITVIVMLILAGVSISVLTGADGLFGSTKTAAEKYNQATQNEAEQIQGLFDELDSYMGSTSQFKDDFGVNAPKTTNGMIPVKYNSITGNWEKADVTNASNDWYSYTSADKKWANVVTVKENGTTGVTGSHDRNYYLSANVGESINMEDILTMFVWVPRYAYSITSGYKQVMDGTTDAKTAKIDVKFLVGSTNKDKDDTEYARDYNASLLSAGDVTPMIVHPAFTLGNKELTGLWVAKFEASGINDENSTAWTNYVGNRSATSSRAVAVTDNTVLTVKPSVPSWGEITIGNAQTQSMKLTSSTSYGWENNKVDGHLIKNNEWGAVAYLCYSQYGNIPMINATRLVHRNVSNAIDYYYDLVTGAGPTSESSEAAYDYNSADFATTHAYNTTNGVLASTTGNVYGIYDMNGGNWERTACYLDNGNNSLSSYAGQYFEGADAAKKLKDEYIKYWDKYEVGEEERTNKIRISESQILTQSELWNTSKYQEAYNAARLRMTTATVNNMINNKGDAMYERISEFSYYGAYNSGTDQTPAPTWNWFKTVPTAPYTSAASYSTSWNGDFALIGGSARPFVARGSDFNDGGSAGVCFSGVTYGGAGYGHGFRPVLGF